MDNRQKELSEYRVQEADNSLKALGSGLLAVDFLFRSTVNAPDNPKTVGSI